MKHFPASALLAADPLSHWISGLRIDQNQLREKLRSGESKMLVVDKASYCETVDGSGMKVAVPGESESFVCFKV